MAPYLPIALTYQNRSLQVSGLLDTGEACQCFALRHWVAIGSGLGGADNFK